MKKTHLLLSILALSLASSLALADATAPQMELAKKKGCLACHELDAQKVGPAWKEVAKKYAHDPEAEAKLITKVKKGGKGVWGEVPMPPNVTVKKKDIVTLVQFVLSLK
jgi:cytochrome c